MRASKQGARFMVLVAATLTLASMGFAVYEAPASMVSLRMLRWGENRKDEGFASRGMGMTIRRGINGSSETPSTEYSENESWDQNSTPDSPFTVSLEDEIQWLADSFREDGAFCQNPLKARVVPYFANLAALSLLPERPDLVRKYVDWYLHHLNRPDRWGMSGTIYDYLYREDVEIAARSYDSADSYAATFLGLVTRLCESTGDREFIAQRLPAITTVASVLLELQDPSDGLIWALPNRWSKFLMDNCENYWGLHSFSRLLRLLDMPEDAQQYEDAAIAVRDGIQNRLFNENDGSYFWCLNALGIRRSATWSRWYPDAVSQLYPALFRVIGPGDLSRQVCEKLNEAHPAWHEFDKTDRFPWALVAYVSMRNGDAERATAFIQHAEKIYLEVGRPYPWHSTESAYLIEAKRGLLSPGSPFFQ